MCRGKGYLWFYTRSTGGREEYVVNGGVVGAILFLIILNKYITVALLAKGNSSNSVVCGFTFLTIVTIVCLTKLFNNVFQMSDVKRTLTEKARRLSDVFGVPKGTGDRSLSYLGKVFRRGCLSSEVSDFMSTVRGGRRKVKSIRSCVGRSRVSLRMRGGVLRVTPSVFADLNVLNAFVNLM